MTLRNRNAGEETNISKNIRRKRTEGKLAQETSSQTKTGISKVSVRSLSCDAPEVTRETARSHGEGETI